MASLAPPPSIERRARLILSRPHVRQRAPLTSNFRPRPPHGAMVLCTGASAASGHFSQTALPVICTDLYLPRFAVIPPRPSFVRMYKLNGPVNKKSQPGNPPQIHLF